jgi:hypothetical protein
VSAKLKFFLGDNMFKRTLILGTIALASATAFGGPTTKGGDFYTVTVETGQGSPIVVSVPVAPQPISAPYALTGQAAAPSLHLTTMEFGQGGPILVAE